jgi:hypothetical protein
MVFAKVGGRIVERFRSAVNGREGAGLRFWGRGGGLPRRQEVGDKGFGRVPENVSEGALLQDPAPIDDDDRRGQIADFVRIMCDKQSGDRKLCQVPFEGLSNQTSTGQIERGEWLIEQEQLGLGSQAAGQGDSLQLPTRQLARPLLPQMVQVELAEQGRQPVIAEVLGHPGDSTGDVLGDREMWEESGVLKHHSHPARLRRKFQVAGGIDPGFGPKLNAAILNWLKSGEDSQQGALARARHACDSSDGGGMERQLELEVEVKTRNKPVADTDRERVAHRSARAGASSWIRAREARAMPTSPAEVLAAAL